MTSPTLKCRPHTPSYLWVTQKCCLIGVRAWWWNFYGWCLQKLDIRPKNTNAPKRVILGNLGQKKACQGARRRPARNPKLPRDSFGYGDDILMLERSVGVQKMEVFGCSIKKMGFFDQKNGPKTCPAASHEKLSTQKKSDWTHCFCSWGKETS